MDVLIKESSSENILYRGINIKYSAALNRYWLSCTRQLYASLQEVENAVDCLLLH